MAPRSLLSRAFFLLSATLQVIGTLKADWSDSHIYNAKWPPHAKFHTGQTMSMSIVLAALALYFAFRPKTWYFDSGQRKKQRMRDDAWTAMVVLDVYFVTQSLAFLFPGTHWCDEGFCFDAPFPPQLGIGAVFVTMNTLAYGFELWALSGWDGLNQFQREHGRKMR